MALDTKDKRVAVLDWDLGSLPDPDGAAFDLGDRAQLLGMPRLAAAAPPPTPSDLIDGRLSIGISLGF